MPTIRTTRSLVVHAADPARLTAIRARGQDEFGNAFTTYDATGDGEPLRCCLRNARADERIALISWAPFTAVSPWREVGPVYVHGVECEGWTGPSLPPELRRGPSLLRTYREDGTMNYEQNTLVHDQDLEALLVELLDGPEVATVHVRTVRPQCFLYAVTRGDSGGPQRRAASGRGLSARR